VHVEKVIDDNIFNSTTGPNLTPSWSGWRQCYVTSLVADTKAWQATLSAYRDRGSTLGRDITVFRAAQVWLATSTPLCEKYTPTRSTTRFPSASIARHSWPRRERRQLLAETATVTGVNCQRRNIASGRRIWDLVQVGVRWAPTWRREVWVTAALPARGGPGRAEAGRLRPPAQPAVARRGTSTSSRATWQPSMDLSTAPASR